MTKTDKKEALCRQHTPLLHILLRYGGGAILQPQLRALCLSLDLYPSEQAVNRAVRDLRDAGILTRQTWVDHNSDLLLARKYVYRYFSGQSSQEVATPHRPSTMGPYILGARRLDWLLTTIKRENLRSLDDVEPYLRRHACTMFFRRPELASYYRRYAPILGAERPERYQEQLACLDQSASPSGIQTLQRSHTRGLYITAVSTSQKAVAFSMFAGRATQAERVADWAIDAHSWLTSLLPYFQSILTVYVLDTNHYQALRAAFTTPAIGTNTGYWQHRLEGAHMAGRVHLTIKDTDFPRRWCGGVHRIDL